jgi:hypothetical protein
MLLALGGKKKTKSQSLDGTTDEAIAIDLYTNTSDPNLHTKKVTQASTQASNLREALLIHKKEHTSFAKTLKLFN